MQDDAGGIEYPAKGRPSAPFKLLDEHSNDILLDAQGISIFFYLLTEILPKFIKDCPQQVNYKGLA